MKIHEFRSHLFDKRIHTDQKMENTFWNVIESDFIEIPTFIKNIFE